MSDVLHTRVGRAEHGDNRFRGASVAQELAGKTTLASMFARAVGRPLGVEDAHVLDDLASCCLAADPRIWPLKLVRVATAHGNVVAGLCAAFLGGRGRFGPTIVGAAAELFHGVAAEARGGTTVAQAVARRLEAPGARLPGYGVVRREVDERVVALSGCVSARGRTAGPMWRLAFEVEEHARRLRDARINIAGALAAVLLDLGFSPAEVPAIMVALLLPNWLANAVEGAEQAPAVLQRLPRRSLGYAGPEPRQSPRALGNDA